MGLGIRLDLSERRSPVLADDFFHGWFKGVGPGILVPAASSWRTHHGLTCRLVAVRRCAVLVVAKGQRPHPRRTHRRGVNLKDAADNSAVGEHVEIVVVPFAGWARS